MKPRFWHVDTQLSNEDGMKICVRPDVIPENPGAFLVLCLSPKVSRTAISFGKDEPDVIESNDAI